MFNLTIYDATYFLIYVVLFLYLFFGVYVLIMGLYRAHLDGVLTKPGYVLGFPWLLIGYAMDVVANLTIFMVLFAEVPREWLVTARLQRHLHVNPDPTSWRYKLAALICAKLLDYFDPRKTHC